MDFKKGRFSAEVFQPAPFDPQGFRYTAEAFPPYRHIPRVTPHPRRHPMGHHFGKPEPISAPFDPEHWFASAEYLHGVDLYNFAYYWEAHEAWEACWKSAGVKKPARLFLQGLIQISAALLKKEQRLLAGMTSLARQGLARLGEASNVENPYCGLDIPEFTGRMSVIFMAEISVRWPADPRIQLLGIEPLTGKGA
ncbi:MAG TPA: DUF309 domain-containing protein [Acidobacteriota bacterium]|jgi:hypothetical protein